jgi:hypothetical protein
MDTDMAVMGTFEKLPWEMGKTYTYRYQVQGKVICTDTFTLAREETAEGIVYAAATRLESQTGTIESTWRITAEGVPLQYRVQGKMGAAEYTIDCAFENGKVTEKVVQAGKPVTRTIELPQTVYLLDNNNLSFFAFLLTAVPRTEGATLSFQVFHPSSMQLLPMQVEVRAKEKVGIQDREVECHPFDITLAGTKILMYLDEKGRVLKDVEADGAMIVELTEE